MKTFLILFVLFFSSSVVAGEDLKGKKIYCELEWVDGLKEEVNQLGFNFYDKEIVEVIKSKYSHYTKQVTSKRGEYFSYEFYIYIQLFPDGSDYYHINRRDLEISYLLEPIYPSETCKIIEVEDLYSYINNKFEEKVSEIKSKNKI
ncbi:hypothetical protein OAJ30_01160 [Alphaproteobacteria bacterium]|nr:hypothetical protein [Alphaproteobacteria bacterium]